MSVSLASRATAAGIAFADRPDDPKMLGGWFSAHARVKTMGACGDEGVKGRDDLMVVIAGPSQLYAAHRSKTVGRGSYLK